MLEIQIALDRIPLELAVDISAAVAPFVDGVEVGTSLVKRYGMPAVREIAEAVRDVAWVHADLKTVDDATTEVRMAIDAGAVSVSVLALASDTTIDTAVATAHDRGAEVVLDLMRTDDARRAALAERLDARVRLGAHVGKDDQRSGINVLDMLGPWAHGKRLAVAGGLGLADVPALRSIPALRLVVGSAVTKADNPAAAAQALDHARTEIRNFS